MTYDKKNNWILLYNFLFLLNLVLTVQVLPKRNNRLRFGNQKIKFPNSFAHLEVNGKPKSASSLEITAMRRSLPWKYQDIKKLFDENGVMYLPRLTKLPYFVNDNLEKKNGNFDAPRHRSLKRLLKDILEDKNKYSSRKEDRRNKDKEDRRNKENEDRRNKENEVRMFLIQALRRFGREKPRGEFEFSELVD